MVDPRVKFLATLIFVVTVTTTPVLPPRGFLVFLLPLGVLALVGRVDPWLVLRRSLWVAPFILMMGLSWYVGDFPNPRPVEVFAGCSRATLFLAMSLKVWISSVAVALLTLTTGPTELARGLMSLGLPKDIGLILLFFQRYLSVIMGEARRMRISHELRASRRSRLLYMRTLGYLIGSLFLRVWERVERISRAMIMRGFTGRMPDMEIPRVRRSDLIYLAGFSTSVFLIRLLVSRVV